MPSEEIPRPIFPVQDSLSFPKISNRCYEEDVVDLYSICMTVATRRLYRDLVGS